jgi:hypothetical protein
MLTGGYSTFFSRKSKPLKLLNPAQFAIFDVRSIKLGGAQLEAQRISASGAIR